MARVRDPNLRGLTPGFLRALASHDGPGNAGEWQNVVERGFVLAESHEPLGLEDTSQPRWGLAGPEEMEEETPGPVETMPALRPQL